ncbi:MAG: hypothetical protein ACM31C_11530 [Acidobacteriota bacterium]
MRWSLLLVVLVAACAADPPANESADPTGGDGKADGPGDGWTGIGLGVEYQRVNTGNAILIAYGGYTAHLSYSAAWASELVDAKLGGQDVGQIYAVKGPADASYDGKEIANSALRAHLATIDDGTSPIYVIAHSSGAYVANELLGQLQRAGATDVLARIDYSCLEGGGAGLDQDIVDSLHAIQFVYARDTSLAHGYSENAGAEQALAMEYAPHATSYEVVVPDTGCDDGAGWCLHDVVVTHKPHHSWSYDLADDYTDFVDRPVTVDYLR